jgi:hypothetical protein
MKQKHLLSIIVALASLLLQNQAYSKANPDHQNKAGQNQIFMQRTTQDTIKIHRYGEKIAELLLESDWPAILDEIHAVNLPEGWEEMIKPSFEPYFDKKLSVSVIPFEQLPDYQLKWLYKAPEGILVKTKWAIRLDYDHSTPDETKKGNLKLAVYEKEGGECSVLVVGGE